MNELRLHKMHKWNDCRKLADHIIFVRLPGRTLKYIFFLKFRERVCLCNVLLARWDGCTRAHGEQANDLPKFPSAARCGNI